MSFVVLVPIYHKQIMEIGTIPTSFKALLKVGLVPLVVKMFLGSK